MDFGERVRELVRARNTTQEWVARSADISFRTFAGWLQKGREPTASKAVAIATALGTTVEYLVTGQESVSLGSKDLALLARARRWACILDDLEALDPAGQHGFAVALHANAQEARALRESQAQA